MLVRLLTYLDEHTDRRFGIHRRNALPFWRTSSGPLLHDSLFYLLASSKFLFLTSLLMHFISFCLLTQLDSRQQLLLQPSLLRQRLNMAVVQTAEKCFRERNEAKEPVATSCLLHSGSRFRHA